MTHIQVSSPLVFPIISPLSELSSENMDNIMNKIVKIMSSVISWERLPDKGHCDLDFTFLETTTLSLKWGQAF